LYCGGTGEHDGGFEFLKLEDFLFDGGFADEAACDPPSTLAYYGHSAIMTNAFFNFGTGSACEWFEWLWLGHRSIWFTQTN
jgi:hypothetical protein